MNMNIDHTLTINIKGYSKINIATARERKVKLIRFEYPGPYM